MNHKLIKQLVSIFIFLLIFMGSYKAQINFVDSGQSLGNSKTRDIALGDYDSDGDLDMICTNYGQPNTIWWNDGNGFFTDSENLGDMNDPSQTVSVADVDGDGDLDALVANWSGSPSYLWFNDGFGNFTLSDQQWQSGDTYSGVFADLGNDGDLDVVFGDKYGDKNDIYFNDGNGNFELTGLTSWTGITHYSIELADLDGDDDLDVVRGSIYNSPDKIYFNDGSNNFYDSGQGLYSLGRGLNSGLALGDLDSDGDIDIYSPDLGTWNGGYDRVWINDGSGYFTIGQDFPFLSTWGVQLGDLDGDGDLDACVSSYRVDHPNKIYLNDGSGHFTDSGLELGYYFRGTEVALGDLDNDGDLDAVFAVQGDVWGVSGEPNKVWFNGTAPVNEPPDCSRAVVAAQFTDGNCSAEISPEDVEGVTDPDGDELIITVNPTTLILGANTVTVTADDGNGGTCSSEIVVDVEDITPPVLTVITEPITLWPPNHKYVEFSLSDFVLGVSDNCSYLDIEDVYVVDITSDEPEDAKGNGDGKTKDDIVIDDDIIKLRAERQGQGDGRVYIIDFAVDDGNGNITAASAEVHVPHNKNSIAVHSGPYYRVNRSISFVSGSKGADAVFEDSNNLLIDELPTVYSLKQNYPNPFNPTTSISYTLPEAGYVRLSVYNTLGQEVAVLVEGNKTAGSHSVNFYAEDLVSGIYLYKLEANNHVEIKKMLLIK